MSQQTAVSENANIPQSDNEIVEKTHTEVLLERLLDEQIQQGKQMHKQLRWTQWIATASVALAIISLFLCMSIVPKAAQLLGRANIVASEVQSTVQLLNEKLPGTLQEIDSLIDTNSAGITKALTDVQSVLQKLNAFDIDSLNEAIADLAGIVRPMASLFGR